MGSFETKVVYKCSPYNITRNDYNAHDTVYRVIMLDKRYHV